jgi:protein-L-isoaspartate O-methyltransferase
MRLNRQKIDESALALRWLTLHDGCRVLEIGGPGWDGPTAHISNPANRNKSVELTEQGLAEAEGLAKKLFS